MSEQYSSERESYVRKLSSQIEGMDKLLSMDTYGLINYDSQKKIEELRENAERLRKKLKNNEFEIAIVGLEKAGKSTFANAMMGNDILPSKDGRCTYTSTSICYGEDYAVVEFFSFEEFNKMFVDKLSTMKIEHAENLSFRTLSLRDYQRKFKELDSDTREKYETSLNMDIEKMLENKEILLQFIGRDKLVFSGAQELSSSRFKAFIEDPAYAIAVKEIIIQSSKLARMPNAIIYDVPGFDSPTMMHLEQTKAKMKTADVIILIASAAKPSITKPVVDVYRDGVDGDNIRFGDKTFVFANRADDANTLQQNMETLRSELKSYRIVTRDDFLKMRVVPGSARAKLEEEGKVTGHSAMNALKEKGIDNGIETMHRLLESYNESERLEVLMRRVDRIQSELQELFDRLLADQSNSVGSDYLKLHARLVAELLQKSQISIENGLYKFDEEIKNTYGKAPLITDRLKSEVIDSITIDAYGVTDAEMDHIKMRHMDGRGGYNSYLIEADLRTIKTGILRSKFVEKVVNLSTQEHEMCDKRIVDIFMDGFHVSEGNIHYNTIKKSVEEYIDRTKFSNDTSGYYRSLVDRFSLDLITILISHNFGNISRWDYFKKHAANFYSFAMFDENRDLFAPIDCQPLYYALLFQDFSRAEVRTKTNALLQELSTEIGEEFGADDEVVRLVQRFVSLSYDTAEKFVREKCKSISSERDTKRKRTSLLNKLQDAVDRLEEDSHLNGSANLDEAYYKEFFKDRESERKSFEAIRQDIGNDIDFLRETLKSAAVNAIDIETPFVSLETQTIGSLIESLKSDGFLDLVSEQASLILAEDYATLEEEEQKRRIRKDIKNTIEGILSSMREPVTMG